MASVNKVLLVGHLGTDPEVRFTPTGRAVCTFSLATSEQWKTDTGQTRTHGVAQHRGVGQECRALWPLPQERPAGYDPRRDSFAQL